MEEAVDLRNIDFYELAQEYSPLKRHLKTIRKRSGGRQSGGLGKGATVRDWKDPRALRDLCCAILWKYFNLRLEIPLDSLIPPVPSRMDYILFIEHLLSKDHHLGKSIKGIDLGTGSSCIYPLLGCASHKNWSFLGLEKNKESLEYAQANIDRNELQDRIHLHHNVPKDDRDSSLTLLPKKILKKHGPFDFLMCNPPFYQDNAQIIHQRSFKAQEPHSTCTGSINEMITEGGEVAFVKQLIKESSKRRKYVKWFTCLIGAKADAHFLYSHLVSLQREEAGEEVLSDQSCQYVNVKMDTIKHGFTSRWILSWTWPS